MGRIGTAFRAFFGSLFNPETATRVGQALADEPAKIEPSEQPTPKPQPTPPAPKPPARSEAVTLLATLQREARLIDFVKEPLDGIPDAQVGAAVREIHRNLAESLNRMFQIQPVLTDAEGSSVEVPSGFNAGRYRLVGNVTGEAPYRGTLAHHGWLANSTQLPDWTGNDDSADIIAPAEVELK
ncbi:DUF2760 domain-containing protein [Thalassoroseus pseudoceratinae]|uniref:DUF2760 domain-containing protein n=1 Tax=Thalassoroseus pseudoceratinae TaxID=2713176 RepID=UPI00141E862D|nr:DUF2760 domain-containing protein [Thalassoroseus pseudoceratinae]